MLESKFKKFNHLKIHTQYSICEGAIKIDDLKEFMDKFAAQSAYHVSMEGQLYDFGSCCLCWGNENDE